MSKLIDNWVEQAYRELEYKIREQEDEFLEIFIEQYLYDFYIDDVFLKASSGNYSLANQVNQRFDEAYEDFIIPFLLYYGRKLIEGGVLAVDYMNSIGVAAKYQDIEYIGKAIGLNGKSIVRGSFLWNLGMMGELRQRFQSYVISSITTMQRFSTFVKNARPFFKTKNKTASALMKYYRAYAFNPIIQTLNSASYTLANKYGLKKFVYAGDLIEKSRDFCVERAGNTYTIEQGKSWNNLNWAGKIQGVDFFVQAGGYFCRHHLEYINEEKEE